MDKAQANMEIMSDPQLWVGLLFNLKSAHNEVICRQTLGLPGLSPISSDSQGVIGTHHGDQPSRFPHVTEDH